MEKQVYDIIGEMFNKLGNLGHNTEDIAVLTYKYLEDMDGVDEAEAFASACQEEA